MVRYFLVFWRPLAFFVSLTFLCVANTSAVPHPNEDFSSNSGLGLAISDVCEALLSKWISAVPVVLHAENATLSVDWTDLNRDLEARGCSYEQLWLELWRAVVPEEEIDSVDDEFFASPEYFSKFERCHKLEPERFAYHSIRPHAGYGLAGKGRVLDEKEKRETIFLHVVENDYILRLCPCGKRKLQKRVCDCERSGSGQSHCSGLLPIRQPLGDSTGVYPWCGSDSLFQNENAVKKKKDEIGGAVMMTMDSPGTTCTSVTLSGTLISCTPIQSYDRVRVTFHPVDLAKRLSVEDTISLPAATNRLKNFLCDTSYDFGQDHASAEFPATQVEQRLVDAGNGTGEWSVLAEGLRENSTFCIQVEIVDHPYCNWKPLVNRPQFHGKDGEVYLHPLPPVVCVNRVAQPVVLPSCTDSFGAPVPKLNMSVESSILSLVTVTVILITFSITVYAYRRKRRRSHSDSGVRNGEDSYPKKDLVLPLTEGVVAKPPGDIFFLHFPESKSFEKLNGMLRDWMGSRGCRCFDLSDPMQDERVCEDPEGWVLGILGRPNVRVIIVDSPSARLCLSSSSSVVEDTERSPLVCSSTLPESALEDNRHELRVFALRHIQSHFLGKYKRLVVVRYEGLNPQCDAVANEGSNSNGSPAANGGGIRIANGLQSNEGVPSCSATDPLSRILTPHRGCLLLPRHLPELKSWFQGLVCSESQLVVNVVSSESDLAGVSTSDTRIPSDAERVSDLSSHVRRGTKESRPSAHVEVDPYIAAEARLRSAILNATTTTSFSTTS